MGNHARENAWQRMARRAGLLRVVLEHPHNQGHRLRALGRMLGWQMWRYLARRPVTSRFWEQLSVRVYPDWPYSWTAIYLGLPEYDDMIFTTRYLRPGDALVDVGANIGFYSLLASAVNGGAPVVALEPHPVASARLRENAALNGFDNIKVRTAAAGDAPAIGRLTSDLVDQNRMVDEDSGQSDEPTLTVPVVTLDSELRRLRIDPSTVRLVKIDTEGFEARVLGGAESLLAQDPGPAWLVEMTGLGSRYGNDDNEVTEIFASHGYRRFRYDATENRLVQSDMTEHRGGNVIFARSQGLVANRLRAA